MPIATLFKLAKALFLFIREMWLRDRTFRQFIHENLSLIVMSMGFVIMSVFFVHVYMIVKDQEAQISQYQFENSRLRLAYDTEVPLLREQVTLYKSRYLEAVAAASHAADPKPPPKPKHTPGKPINPPPTPTTTDRPVTTRGPSTDLVERWKRLRQ